MIKFMELRLLIKEYAYYNGKYPLISELYKKYKEKFDYKGNVRTFGHALHRFQKEMLPIGFIEEEKQYTYKYKGKDKTVKRMVKRVVVR